MGNAIYRIMNIKNKKGQSTLETALIFLLIFLLVGGIIRIWMWSNRQIVRRQINYNETRVAAGTSSDFYLLIWPVYEAEHLSENQVILDSR